MYLPMICSPCVCSPIHMVAGACAYSDFVEAGVFTGGVSIFMTSMLCAKGLLGDGAQPHRRMWMADSFAGMPPASASSRVGYSSEGFTSGTLIGTIGTVTTNFVNLLGRADVPYNAAAVQSRCRKHGVPAGAHFMKGWFNETLPGAIEKVALLRLDSDLYVSIHDTLARLYPRLSVGGYVVFDDFKFTQAQEAILAFRKANSISSVLHRSGPASSGPFHSLDKMVYWQKSASSG